MAERRSIPPIARRKFVGNLLAAAGATSLLTGIELATPPAVLAQSPMTPADAMQALMAGNARFVRKELTSLAQDLQVLKNNTVEKQEPFAAVLACADSRVPIELVFDQTIGHVFVTRVAGNIATSELIASLEYAVAVLGVKVVLVLGHTACGAVKASMTADPVPGQISSLYPYIEPAVLQSGGNLAKAISGNALIQASLLRTSSPVIRDAMKAGKLKVESGVYDLGSGRVTLNA